MEENQILNLVHRIESEVLNLRILLEGNEPSYIRRNWLSYLDNEIVIFVRRFSKLPITIYIPETNYEIVSQELNVNTTNTFFFGAKESMFRGIKIIPSEERGVRIV